MSSNTKETVLSENIEKLIINEQSEGNFFHKDICSLE